MASLSLQQKSLFEALHNSRAEDFKTFNKKDYRGVWSSIVDKYPESAHFVYELLQNADDAEASEVYIILRHDRLLFKHNGTKHFDITGEDAENVGDINSITGIGDSSKVDTQNKIGKFGVGFKAVFQYTDVPEIYDDYFKFKIENYIVPTLLPYDHPERKEGETLFVFPFKDCEKSYNEILRRLEKLNSPILFLRNIKRIVWRVDTKKNVCGEKIEYSKTILDKYLFENVLLEHYRLVESAKVSEMFLFSKEVKITTNDGKRVSHIINVGFYFDPVEKKLETKHERNIFCFFPTKETFKTCFVSHAPFLLTDNRQNLKPGEPVNQYLCEQLAKLAAKAVVCLRDYGIANRMLLIDENITEIIPNYDDIFDLDELFEEPLYDAFSSVLSHERLLLSRNGKYISNYEAYIATPRELDELLSQTQLQQLQKYNYEHQEYNEVLDKLSNVDFLKWELASNISKLDDSIYENINYYSSEDFASDITPEFMRKQDIRWVTRMYTFLRTAAPKLWKITDKEKAKSSSYLPFRKAPIIKTQKNEWVAPFIDVTIPNVYLPLKDSDKSDYNFIAKEYIENELAMKFFKELDIQEPNEYDYIRNVILPKYDGDQKFETEEIQTDFIYLISYYQKINSADERLSYIQLLQKNLFLRDKDGLMCHSCELYFYGKELELYFYGNVEVKYIDIDIYSDAIERFGKEWIVDFLLKLGVKKYPSVLINTQYSWYMLPQEIRAQVSKIDFSEIGVSDYYLEGFEIFCSGSKLDRDASLYLWNKVLPSIQFANYGNSKVKYRKKYARNYDYLYVTSTFKFALQSNRWLVNKNGVRISANSVAIEDLDPEYDLNNGLVQFLGIEKREKSIIDLGGTQEQQDNLDLGKKIKGIAGDLSEEEIVAAIKEARARKDTKNDSNTFNIDDIDNEGSVSKDNAHSSNAPQNVTGSKDSDDIISREELRKKSLNDMFVGNRRVHRETPKEQPADLTDEEDVDEVAAKLLEQEEEHNKIKELREIVSASKKYSKEWFESLIELEYRGSSETDDIDFRKAISITFNSVVKEQGSDRIYVFNNPSRGIPMWMEEIGDIEVKCKFSNADDIPLKFEVANVRDNSLRLKASKAYEDLLKKIDWSKCTKASITLKNQIDLMGKVRAAFNDLDLDEGFNLKENLDSNIKFIFGPPGTGKTTNLANKIISMMNTDDSCKILVLAPTNTACDELARKIQEYSNSCCDWLYRFVSTADEELEDIVIDRESLVYDDSQCCIISTMARLSFDGFNGERGNVRLTDIVWDMVICDEASMIPLAEISLAIYNFLNTPILIAGDPMQIKPILHEEEWKDENIYTMVNLDRFDNPQTEPIQFEIENLGTQYRSVPAIGELFSQYAYDGKLKHYRSSLSKPTVFDKLTFKPICFIPFKVEKYDSVFGVKKLDGSNVHIYSVLLTVGLFKYISQEYAKGIQEDVTIGIVCPYSPQAQLIESLIAQIPNIPVNVKVTVGTVHRFQGGQCKFMFVVLNPPLGIKTASDRIFLNNKNILNVAISRAQDNLCILLPHSDTEGYENLYEINDIGRIAMQSPENVSTYTCDEIEDVIFGQKFYIESNTFVTSHQLANVYTRASKKFEVRIDEKSVDIQLGGEWGI